MGGEPLTAAGPDGMVSGRDTVALAFVRVLGDGPPHGETMR